MVKTKTIIAIIAGTVLTVGAVIAAVVTGVIPGSSSTASLNESTTSGPNGVGTTKTAGTANQTARVAAPPACPNCGVIEYIESVTEKGQATGAGAIGGGVIGGVIGHQIGKGRGRDLATVAGAVGGAIAGHEIEKNVRKVTRYQVGVVMNDGTRGLFTLTAAPDIAVGDRIKVIDGMLVRD